MLATAKLMAFAATRDAARAKTFYAEMLGLRLVADEPYAVVFDANGTMLRVQKVKDLPRAEFTVLGWEVPDIRAAMAALTSRGVHFEKYEFLGPDSDGVWTAPDGTLVAWFKDPDGNTLSLTELKR